MRRNQFRADSLPYTLPKSKLQKDYALKSDRRSFLDET